MAWPPPSWWQTCVTAWNHPTGICERLREDDVRLEGQVAIISGSARGQGAAEARQFCAEGAAVVIGDVLEAEGAALAEELGDAALFVNLDVTDEATWQAAVKSGTERF